MVYSSAWYGDVGPSKTQPSQGWIQLLFLKVPHSIEPTALVALKRYSISSWPPSPETQEKQLDFVFKSPHLKTWGRPVRSANNRRQTRGLEGDSPCMYCIGHVSLDRFCFGVLGSLAPPPFGKTTTDTHTHTGTEASILTAPPSLYLFAFASEICRPKGGISPGREGKLHHLTASTALMTSNSSPTRSTQSIA